jgi:hypothetical protein
MTFAASNDADLAGRSETERGEAVTSVRERFVEQTEVWVRKVAAEVPEHYLQYAMSDRAAPDDLMRAVTQAAGGDPMHRALLLRYMRAVEQMVRTMPADLVMATIAAPSDIGALARALSDPRVSGAARQVDPLAGAVARAISHRRRLMDMAGEFLPSSQVEALLGIRRQAIDKRRNAHRLLAVRMASDWLYPAFQFGEDGLVPGLEAILQAHAGKDPWVILDILLAPDEALGGRTLLQAIQEGDEQAVARHVAQAGGDGFA